MLKICVKYFYFGKKIHGCEQFLLWTLTMRNHPCIVFIGPPFMIRNHWTYKSLLILLIVQLKAKLNNNGIKIRILFIIYHFLNIVPIVTWYTCYFSYKQQCQVGTTKNFKDDYILKVIYTYIWTLSSNLDIFRYINSLLMVFVKKEILSLSKYKKFGFVFNELWITVLIQYSYIVELTKVEI